MGSKNVQTWKSYHHFYPFLVSLCNLPSWTLSLQSTSSGTVADSKRVWRSVLRGKNFRKFSREALAVQALRWEIRQSCFGGNQTGMLGPSQHEHSYDSDFGGWSWVALPSSLALLGSTGHRCSFHPSIKWSLLQRILQQSVTLIQHQNRQSIEQSLKTWAEFGWFK